MKSLVRNSLRSLYHILAGQPAFSRFLGRLREVVLKILGEPRQPSMLWELATTANFSEAGYLAANPDVRSAIQSGAFPSAVQHMQMVGAGEARLQQTQATLSRTERALYGIDPRGAGLEIGPSYNPLVPKKKGFNVKILDHATREDLIKKYTGQPVNVDNIEEVDYVWHGEPIDTLVGQGCYDYVIASHVIEHTTDLVRFLNQLANTLRPDGVISLVIPDRRYCFDYYRFPSTTGDILQAYAEARTRHPAGVYFDYLATIAFLGKEQAWSADAKGDLHLVHSLQDAVDGYHMALNTSDYVDTHCWRFTPASFRLIMNDLRALGLVDLYESTCIDTVGCEFFVVLRKGNGDVRKLLPRAELVQAMMDEQMVTNRRLV